MIAVAQPLVPEQAPHDGRRPRWWIFSHQRRISSANSPKPLLRRTAPTPKHADHRTTADAHTPRTARTDPTRKGLVLPASLARQIRSHRLSVSSQMTGNSRDRPPPPPQSMNFHVLLQCQHKRQGSSPQLPGFATKQLGEGPTQQRVFTPRRWGISVIEPGESQ